MLEINFKFPDWFEKIKANEERINLFLAANMQTNRAELFDAEGAFNGHRQWKKPIFRPDGQTLSLRGTLRKSIGPENDGKRPKQNPNGIVRIQGDVVTIGTSLIYAKILNSGGVVRPKNAKALAFPGPGGKIMFRKKVTIPARDFQSISPQDQAEFEVALTNFVAEVLNE